MIRTYGKAIEVDLAATGVDLATLWRTRRWRKLLNLIDHLPRNSHYSEAVAQDKRLAEMVLRQKQRAPERRQPIRRVSEWTPDVELLSAILDRLGELGQIIVATSGAKPKKVAPAPRPTTALDTVRLQQRRVNHNALVARLLPGRAADTPVKPQG